MTPHPVSIEELAGADKQERMNIFRRYFASSRYNRLLIQHVLVRSAQDDSLLAKVREMERAHRHDFMNVVKTLTKSDFLEEFLIAVKEEDEALAKIIEAYDKRMSRH